MVVPGGDVVPEVALVGDLDDLGPDADPVQHARDLVADRTQCLRAGARGQDEPEGERLAVLAEPPARGDRSRRTGRGVRPRPAARLALHLSRTVRSALHRQVLEVHRSGGEDMGTVGAHGGGTHVLGLAVLLVADDVEPLVGGGVRRLVLRLRRAPVLGLAVEGSGRCVLGGRVLPVAGGFLRGHPGRTGRGVHPFAPGLGGLRLRECTTGHPAGVGEERLGLLGVVLAERPAVIGVGALARQSQMAAGWDGGEPERTEHRLGEFLAVQRPGDGTAYPVVGERTGLAVQRELGEGRLQGLADRVAGESLLLAGVDLDRTGGAQTRGLRLLGGFGVGAMGERPGQQRVGWGDAGARTMGEFPGASRGSLLGVGRRLRSLRGRLTGSALPSRTADTFSTLLACGSLLTLGQGDAFRRTAVDLGDVHLARGEGGCPFGPWHGGDLQTVQLGRLAPPAGVAFEDRSAGLAVDRAQLEGPRGGLEGLARTVVEGIGARGHLLRVQRCEEGLPIRVGLLEGDLDLQVVGALLDLLDALVPRIARGPVGGVATAERAPLGGEVGGSDLSAVAPDRSLVELVEHDLLGFPGNDLRGFHIVGIALGATVAVEGEEGGEHGSGDPGGRRVGVRLEGVQSGGDGVDRPSQGAAVADVAARRRGDVLGYHLAAAPGFVRGAAGQYGQDERSADEEREGTARPVGTAG